MNCVGRQCAASRVLKVGIRIIPALRIVAYRISEPLRLSRDEG
jgi:hypothetical protein